MKASVLLLIVASTVCAQNRTAPTSLIPSDQSRLPGIGEGISLRELLVPPKAVKELQRSQSALRSGDTRSSARHLEKALQIYPNYLEGHNSLGARYIELGEYEKAAAEFQEAIEIDARVSQPFNNLSVADYLLRRYSDAETAARRAMDLDPRSSTPRYVLGCILAAAGRNAIESIEMLRQTESEFPDARLVLAEVLLRRGSREEAKEELRGYLALPSPEKKQRVERWLARLTTADRLAQSPTP